MLKDVLRQYEGQDTHTVHLVYVPKNQKSGTMKKEEYTNKKNSPSQEAAAANENGVQTTSATSDVTDGLR